MVGILRIHLGAGLFRPHAFMDCPCSGNSRPGHAYRQLHGAARADVRFAQGNRMFGLTQLGVVNTAISLVAVAAGAIALIRDKEITLRNTLGKVYVITTILTFFVIPLRRTCLKEGRISAPCRNSSDIAASPRRSATPTFRVPACSRRTSARTRGADR